MRYTWLTWVAFVAGCSRPSPPAPVNVASPPAAPPSVSERAAAPVHIEIRNVHLHFDPNVAVDVRMLRGEMHSLKAGEPPIFDDPASYEILVADGEIAIDMPNLTSLMNHHVFGASGGPISDVEVRAASDGRLEQKGTLKKGVPVPFSMKARVGTTADGRLRLTTDSLKLAGVSAKSLMRLFGLSLDDVVSLKDQRGLEIQGDTLVIAPGDTLPPPKMRARIAEASISNGRLVQRLTAVAGAHVAIAPPPVDSRGNHYIYFSGGVIRFGKLTMTATDLQLVDADESDVFDFFPKQYRTQLVAGYSLNLPSGGLRTFMPDYDDAVRGKRLTPR